VLLMDEPCSALDPIATRDHRGADDRAEERLQRRHRHPQHAAGNARRRHHRLLLGRHFGGGRTGFLVEVGPTKQVFENPQEELTREYVRASSVEDMTMTRLGLVLAVALLAGALPSITVAQTVIRGAGASFPANLYAAWIERFNEENPDVRIVYESVGSGEGIRRFEAGTVDFGATERPMDDAQIAALEGGVLHVPTTAGMVVLGFNIPDFEGELRLSRATLGRIFSGGITEWSDPAITGDNLGRELPDRTIGLVTRRDASGTTYIFSSFLDRASPVWREAEYRPGTLVNWRRAMTALGNEGVSAKLGITEYSLGYVEFSFARQLGLATALIENRGGAFVAPSDESGRAALAGAASMLPDDGRLIVADAAQGYPIIGYTWILVPANGHADPAVTDGIRRFLSWALTEGQSMAEPIGYLALPEPVVARAKEILARLP
jgi:phosphate transport system substrate-binding protein